MRSSCFCDSSKFDHRSVSKVCDLGRVATLVTDSPPPRHLADALARGQCQDRNRQLGRDFGDRLINLQIKEDSAMPFDFFSARAKVVIAMGPYRRASPARRSTTPTAAWIGSSKRVGADVEKLQQGGVHAIMFGNENDRPYRFFCNAREPLPR